MKHVLIVDDEQPFLLSVRDGLAHAGQRFRLHLAFDGQEAVKILRREQIDLVVTDLKMPVMDGFQLLAYMATHFPGIPVIVMTAFGTPEIEERLKKVDAFRYLEKPLDLEALASAIEQGLANGSRSFIRGITLATFLQLVKMENKTCTLKIKSETGLGKLFINKGELFDAETGDQKGEAAAYQIVCWPNPEIEMEGSCPRKEKVINESIEHILLEAFRMEDERKNAEQENQAPAKAVEANDWSDVQGLLDDKPAASAPPAKPVAAKAPAASRAASAPTVPAASVIQFLQQTPGVEGFALFDARDFLRRQQPEGTGLGKLHPSLCLAAAAKVGTELEHQLAFVEMRDREGRRFVICRATENQVVAELKSGSRVLEIIDQLRRSCQAS